MLYWKITTACIRRNNTIVIRYYSKYNDILHICIYIVRLYIIKLPYVSNFLFRLLAVFENQSKRSEAIRFLLISSHPISLPTVITRFRSVVRTFCDAPHTSVETVYTSYDPNGFFVPVEPNLLLRYKRVTRLGLIRRTNWRSQGDR